jgi:CubicO group peptidase (beta-lactamase class C family)
MKTTARWAVTALLITAPAGAGTTPQPPWATKAEAVIDAHLPDPASAAAVAVVKNGTLTWKWVRGLANRDDSTAVTADSVFYLGSLSKQFTATAVVLLAVEGKIDLDAPVGRYLPQLQQPVSGVPVHNLLHHSSGIRDYLKLRDLAGAPKDAFFDNESVMRRIARQRSLVFEPGARFNYSNSNYILLAEVVRAVSGEALPEFARHRIFDPVGMSSTFFESDHRGVVPHRVVSYRSVSGEPPERFTKLFDSYGDGGAWSTLKDMVTWDGAIRSRGVFPEEFWDLLLRPDRFSDGSENPYACALRHGDFQGHPTIEHGGFMLGFRDQYVRVGDHDLAIILLTAERTVDDRGLRDDLLRAALGGPEPTPEPEPAHENHEEAAAPGTPPTPLPPIPDELVGCWYSDEVPAAILVSREDDTLAFQPPAFRKVRLQRTGERTFAAFGGSIVFRWVQQAASTQPVMVIDNSEMGGLVFERVHADVCRLDH